MRKYWPIILLIGVIGHAPILPAYEILTHANLSRNAAEKSVLGDNSAAGVLSSIGLYLPIQDDVNQTFPNSMNENRSILELIQDGASFEDNFPRFLNHFYDPLNNRPLTLPIIGALGERSPDWALEDPDTFLLQSYSYRDAQDYFYRALTLPDETARNENFGLTFQTLGQVIHHIQDMAQPQHVRNDAHPPLGKFRSRYEDYTDQVRMRLPFSGYPTVAFDTPRQFWHTTEVGLLARRGMADYTNRGFVSAGTMPAHPDFPLPSLGNPWQVDVRVLFAQADPPVPVPSVCQNDANPCYMIFLINQVVDSVVESTETNDKAATLSIFDQDLQIHNLAARYITSGGQVYDAPQIYALNRFNFDSAHDFLIPRAVSYSAGLIDYFFRGRLDVIRVEEEIDPVREISVYRLTIKNISGASNPFSNGALEFFYEDINGIRRPMAILDSNAGQLDVTRLDVGAEMEVVVEVPDDRDFGAHMTLVFQGEIGGEPGIAGRVFDTESDVYVLDVVNKRVYQFTSAGTLKNIRTASSNIGLSVYADTFYTASPWDGGDIAENDTSVNDTEVYRSYVPRFGDPWVDVYDHQGGFLRHMPVNPGYSQLGGEVRVAANNTHFATTNNEELFIYALAGTQLSQIGGIDINNQEVAITKDRVYIVDAGLIKIYSPTGNYEGVVSPETPYWEFASLAVTENHVYITETKWNGSSRARTNELHIYDRDVVRNELGEITSDSYRYRGTVDFSAVSDQPRSAAVDSARILN
jgi:hypothetical protein